MMKLKSCLKTTKALKLVEDFTEEAPDVTLASVITTVVMLISFLFREEAILKLRTKPMDVFEKIYGIGIYLFFIAWIFIFSHVRFNTVLFW